MLSRFPILLAGLALLTSCNHYRGTYYQGNYKSYTHSWKYPDFLFPMRLAGHSTLTDTVTNRVVERTKFKSGVGVFGSLIDRSRTTSFDKRGHKIKVVTMKNNKTKTVEYRH